MTLNIASTQRSPIAKLAALKDYATHKGIAKTHQSTTIERLHTVKEPDINIELYSTGWFDGLMGYSPELPHFKDYWDGYQLGYREYCCGLLGVEISETETSFKHLINLMVA